MFNLFKKKPIAEVVESPKRKAPNWARVIHLSENMQNMAEMTYPVPVLPAGVCPESHDTMAMDGFCTASQYTDFDAQFYSSFLNYNVLTQLSQSSEYRLVAETFAQEMTREWGEVKGEDEEKIKLIEAELKRLNVRAKLRKSVENDFLFGGSQMYIDIEGQEEKTDLPLLLNEKGIAKGSFRGLVVREPLWSTPAEYNSYDALSDTFFKPQKWYVMGKIVHESRLMTLVTKPVPDILKPMYNFYGVSMTQLMLPYVQRLQSVCDATAKVIEMFSLTGVKTDMSSLLAGDENGANELVNRLKALAMLRRNDGVVAVDMTTEDIFQINTPLTGLDVLMDKFTQMVAYPSRMPVLKVFGTPTGGLGNTSDGEIRVFYDNVSAQQEAFLLPQMRTILSLIQLSLFGKIDKEIEFKFNPLYQLDDNERADVNLKKAQTAQIYLTESVIDGDEVRKHLTEDEDSGYILEGNAPEPDPYTENENIDIDER
jgi:uncharacterized protein